MTRFREDRTGAGRLEDRDAGVLRHLLERAVAASASGIVITDPALPDNPIIYANPAFERITGYAVDEVLGRNCRFLQGEDRDQPRLAEVQAAVEEGRECRVVLRNYRKSGERFWNELYISPVYDDAGRLINFIGVQNDITGRKEAEEERDTLLAREQLARMEAGQARRRLALLAEAGSRFSASLDYSDTLEQIARLVVPELADWCLVDTLEQDGSVHQAAAAHADPAGERLLERLAKHRRFGRSSPGTVAKVLRTGRPALVSETHDPPLEERATGPEHLRLLRELDVSSYISVPLRARGRTLGALTVGSSDPGHRYGQEDLSILQGVAYRCALALDNARLYSERSEIARTLQRSLLPNIPEPAGVEVGVQYLPLGEENEVGGDFYDLIDTGSSWLAVIGDVVGKGAAAAAVTALARYTIRAVALYERSPSRILAALNEAMLGQLADHRFCTVACASLKLTRSGAELAVARGGHPAPLLLRSGGAVESLSPPGKLLGVMPRVALEEETVRLLPGDAAVFYTDGLAEARTTDGSVFGEERLLKLVRSCRGLPAREIAGRLREAALKHSGGNPRDDLAVLVLRIPERS
ncbi:PAS domain-containing protein [Rubrobacter taiwanensis]|uniref:PAS domain-containing protein n=1 Tax=Rubrobacter taiwanensis TaxID=185139 RepID=A0A4R1BCW9_9ACTN|nr:GAF domain-containing SpoIIE family protein phosphatase [Rubrobacter taiwanensis]TCJ14808.1 PAS domain-containing protein [Rubrobacter taiwanensis]